MNVLKRGTVLIFILFLTAVTALAQQVRFDRENFPGREAELTQALRDITEGENLFFEAEVMLTGKGLDLRYASEVKKLVAEGLTYFLRANEFNPNSAQLNLMVGKCYLYLENPAKALKYFNQAKVLDDQTKDIDFLMGWCYQLAGDVDNAIVAYDLAMKRNNTLAATNTITAKLKECRYAKTLIDDAMDVAVENLQDLNTSEPDFLSVVMTNDEYLFFERFIDGKPHIYMSTRTAEGWGVAEPTGQIINISPAGVLSEVELLLPDGKPLTSKWFALNDDPRHTTTRYLTVATLAEDGNIAYFASNRYSGMGGFDIYFSQRDKKGKWERPRNMGDAINTPGDEYGVAVSPDGKTLYFSSNGFPSMGGYDIYKSTFDGKRWSRAENLGYPINSMANDVMYSVSNDGNRLYFSSVRNGGKGDHDLYAVNFVPGMMPSVGKDKDIVLIAEAEKPAAVLPVAPETTATVEPEAVTAIVDLRPVEMGIATEHNTSRQIEDMPEVVRETPQPVAEVTPEPVKEEPAPAAVEEEEYEDIVILSPLVAAEEEPVVDMTKERAVRYTGLLTNSRTFHPLVSALVKVTNKATEEETIVYSDARGVYDFTVASGNSYTMVIESSGYQSYTEELVIANTAEPLVNRPIQMTALVKETVTDRAAVAVAENNSVTLTGDVMDNRDELLANVTMEFINKKTQEVQSLTTDENGMYSISLLTGNDYDVKLTASGHQELYENVTMPANSAQRVAKDFQLIPSMYVAEHTDMVAEVIEEEPMQSVQPRAEPKPQPVVEVTPEPEPVIEEPAPVVVEEPQPVVAPQPEPQPEPVIEEPAPVAIVEEEPMQPAPAPVAVVKEPQPEPQPVVEVTPEPEPVIEEPAPVVVEEPQPVVAPQPKPQPVVTNTAAQMTLAGTITTSSKQPVKATVVFTNLTQGTFETVTTDNKGAFSKVVLKGFDYSVRVEANGYQSWIKDIPSFDANSNMNLPVTMKKSVEGTLLAAVPFNFDRSSLSDEAMKILNDMLPTLKGKTIQIYSYTDNLGGDGYNTRLAERRLKAISSYLSVNGIAHETISTRALGTDDPVATNLTMTGRKSNNRVEIWTK